jgi:two-component system chemotaxis response regulator CheY
MKPLKILIVDDSATMRRMVRRVVELSEVAIADIYEAANGREALDVIDSQPVDALFTDINMPVMSGIELLKQLSTREAGAKPPLRVVISTDGSDARRKEADGLDVARYLEKPLRPEVMRDVLSDLANAID